MIMTSADNFFGGPPTYSFADDVRIGAWCGGVIEDEPFKQQRTSIEDQNVLLWWDEAKTRPKMQLVLSIDSTLGAAAERVDANDDGRRRLFVMDAGDLNRAAKAALLQVGARSLQRGGVLYVCNTGRRPSKMKGGQPARTFQAAYQPPTPEMLARLDAKRAPAAPQQAPDGFFAGPPTAAPAPAPFVNQPSAAPWQPQAAPPAPAAAPPAFQPQVAAGAPAPSPFPQGTPQYQPQTYQQPAQPQYAPAPGTPVGQQPMVQQLPTQAPPLAQVQQPPAPGPAGPPNPFAAPVVAPAATEQYPGQVAAAQTPPWAQPGYVAGQQAAPAAAPPNPFQPAG